MFLRHGDQRSDWLMTPEVSGPVYMQAGYHDTMSNEEKITSI